VPELDRYLGKPNPFMFVMARKRLGLRTGETVMIGDTMETDIRGAVELGIPAYLVLTGSTKREDVAAYPYQPTGILNSIADLLDLEETASATAEPTAGPAMPMD
jgi:NagD protein